ncbi:MAG: oxygenase MpaB family protein, partial [Mycobacteriales bacterium]
MTTRASSEHDRTGFDIRDHISGLGANAAGAANVVMQLSWPAVGYAVKDSKVESGSAMKHPVKRARTTFTFLAVALLGDEHDQQVFRRALN